MEFYRLDCIITKGDIFIHKYNAPDIIEEHYDEGIPLKKLNKEIQLFYKFRSAHKTDYLGGIHSFPVVSYRFKEIIDKLKLNYLEFYPVQLICEKTKEIDTSYLFINILNNINCFDWEKSKYNTAPEDVDIIFGVNKLVIIKENLQGRDIARIAELRSDILISSRLRTIIEAEGLIGFRFENIEDYRRY